MGVGEVRRRRPVADPPTTGRLPAAAGRPTRIAFDLSGDPAASGEIDLPADRHRRGPDRRSPAPGCGHDGPVDPDLGDCAEIRLAASGSSWTSSATWLPISPPYDVISPDDQQSPRPGPTQRRPPDSPPDELATVRTIGIVAPLGRSRPGARRIVPEGSSAEPVRLRANVSVARDRPRADPARLRTRGLSRPGRGAAARADDVRAEGGPPSKLLGDRCQSARSSAYADPTGDGGDGPRRGRRGQPAIDRRRRRRPPSPLIVQSTAVRQAGAGPVERPGSRASAYPSRSPMDITATRPRCAIATSDG
jgi:hypothetical protein